MLKIFVIVIGIIAVVGFITACAAICDYHELKRKIDSIDRLTIKKFDPYSRTWDSTTRKLNCLKKALHEQGIATDYDSDIKLDFTDCKKTDGEYKKEAEVLVNSVKDNDENFTIFEEIEVYDALNDSGNKQFRCVKCFRAYPIDIRYYHNVRYCPFCSRKIVHFQFL